MKNITTETIDFLFELRLNNNKEWMQENRQRYLDVLKEPMDVLASNILLLLNQMNQGQAFISSVSRINRDIRFSKDKSPYKACKWIVWRRKHSEDWKEKPAYFFELMPEGYRYGMGMYDAPPAFMQRFRAKVDADLAGAEGMISEFQKQNIFVLEGEKYKRKMGEEKSEAVQDWYQRKSIAFTAKRPLEERLYEDTLAEQIVEEFKTLLPLYQFFDAF